MRLILFVFPRVIVNVDVAPARMEVGLNAFATDGGDGAAAMMPAENSEVWLFESVAVAVIAVSLISKLQESDHALPVPGGRVT